MMRFLSLLYRYYSPRSWDCHGLQHSNSGKGNWIIPHGFNSHRNCEYLQCSVSGKCPVPNFFDKIWNCDRSHIPKFPKSTCINDSHIVRNGVVTWLWGYSGWVESFLCPSSLPLQKQSSGSLWNWSLSENCIGWTGSRRSGRLIWGLWSRRLGISECPKSWTEIDSRLQPSNASSPIEATVFGIWIDFNLQKFQNSRSKIGVTHPAAQPTQHLTKGHKKVHPLHLLSRWNRALWALLWRSWAHTESVRVCSPPPLPPNCGVRGSGFQSSTE